MNRFAAIFLGLFCWVLFVFPLPARGTLAAEPVLLGDSYQIVLEKLGTPANYIKGGRNEILFYPDSIIEMMDGKVVAIDGRQPPRPSPVNSGEKEGDEAVSLRPETAERFIDVRQNGAAIDIESLIVADAYTVIAFYADW